MGLRVVNLFLSCHFVWKILSREVRAVYSQDLTSNFAFYFRFNRVIDTINAASATTFLLGNQTAWVFYD